MKDKKFVILLVFITVVALANLFGFLLMYETHKRVNILADFHFKKRRQTKELQNIVADLRAVAVSLIETGIKLPFYIDDLTVRRLRIINDNNESVIRMWASALGNPGIWIGKQKRSIDYGPGDAPLITMRVYDDYPQIILDNTKDERTVIESGWVAIGPAYDPFTGGQISLWAKKDMAMLSMKYADNPNQLEYHFTAEGASIINPP